jgi:DNA repair protein RecO
MQEEKTEGILLQSIPYLGREKILKVLSQNNGLISLIAKNRAHLPFTNPFLIAEWVYKKRNSAIYSLKDVSLHKDLSELRLNFSTLSHAGQIAQDLLLSQLPEKKGEGPYALVVSYLSKLPQSSSPEALLASFRLKLLMHDGLLGLQNECTQCDSQGFYLENGESVCKAHSFATSLAFNLEEWQLLQHLTFVRKFSELQDLTLSLQMQEKIKKIFYSSYQISSNHCR